MVNKLAIPLATDNGFTTRDCSMVQGDIKMIGNVVDTLIVEFDQATYEEYLSYLLRSTSPSSTLWRIKFKAPVKARASSFSAEPSEANAGVFYLLQCQTL